MLDVFSPRRVVKPGDRQRLRRAYRAETRDGSQTTGALLAGKGSSLPIQRFVGKRITMCNWSRLTVTQLGRYNFRHAD